MDEKLNVIPPPSAPKGYRWIAMDEPLREDDLRWHIKARGLLNGPDGTEVMRTASECLREALRFIA